MKRFLIVLVLTFQFAFGEPVESIVILTIDEEEEIVRDTLVMPVYIEVLSNREIEVISILGEIDGQIKNASIEYKGGSYSVYKNCVWEKDKMKCSGYKGNLHYNFQLADANLQSKIIQIVDNAQQKYQTKVNYTISEPFWSVSGKKIKDIQNSLKIKILDKAVEFKNFLGKKMNKSCDIAEINFEQLFRPVYKPIPMETLSAQRVETPQPKQDTETIYLRALVKYRCKQ